MLLAIDIGNTNIVLGVWTGSEWLQQWRLRTVPKRTADEYGINLKGLLREIKLQKKIKCVVISSVVPPLTATFQTVCERYLKLTPLFVTSATPLGIDIRVDVPELVGADRLVNAAAAFHLIQDACIVVDMGTATKLDVVSSQGSFLGGVITPGLQITADALFQRAAKLSQVDLVAPPKAIGTNTVHALQSGLIFGYASLIDGLIPRLKAELREQDAAVEAIRVVATGGLITLVAPHLQTLDEVDPWLTLTGLRVIADKMWQNE